MSSDSILNQLYEIAQSNTKEEIGYNDFKRDLRNSLDVESDEYFRALKLILLQAKKTPESLGKSNNGNFVFSEGIITKTLLTIKYENQFIPGKPEFNQRVANENMKKDVSGVLITGTLLSNMIDNYDKLTIEEMEKVSKMYPNMTITQKKHYAEKLEENAIKNEKEAKTEEEKKEWKELREYHGVFKEIFEAIKHDDIEKVQKILKENPDIAQTVRSKLPSEKSKKPLEKISEEDLCKAVTDVYGDIQKYHTIKKTLKDIDKKLEDPNLSDEEKKHLLEERKRYTTLEEEYRKKRDKDTKEKLGSHKGLNKSKDSKEEKNPQSYKVKDEKDELERLSIALRKYGYSEKEIKEALADYKKIISSVDIEEIKSMENEQIIDSLFSKAEENVKTEKSEEILGVILPLTYGNKRDKYSLQKLLGNEKSKEGFLQELDEVIAGNIKDTKQDEPVHENDEIDELLAQYFENKAVEMDVSATKSEPKIYEDSLTDEKNNNELGDSADTIYDDQESNKGSSNLFNKNHFIDFSKSQSEATIVSVGDSLSLLQNIDKSNPEKSEKNDIEQGQEV